MFKQFGFIKTEYEKKLIELNSIGLYNKELEEKSVVKNTCDLFELIGYPISLEDNMSATVFYDHIRSIVNFDIVAALTKAECNVIDKLDNESLFSSFYDCLFMKNSCYGSLMEVLIEDGFLDNMSFDSTLNLNGKMMPIYSNDDLICERVFVESSLDTDKDGNPDLLAVYIKRVNQTNNGLKVPVFYIASPYSMKTNDDIFKLHDVEQDYHIKENVIEDDILSIRKVNRPTNSYSSNGETQDATFPYPEIDAAYSLSDYLAVRGFATIYAGGIGTKDSDGLRSCGSLEETESSIAIIEWLTGKRKAYTNKTDFNEVKAWWCNGLVGMGAKSYLGTLATACATTNVEGLKTIIPEAAISNWYEYYRENGVLNCALGWQGDDADLLAQYCLSRRFDQEDYATIKDLFEDELKKMLKEEDRYNANYNRFWDERNYLNNTNDINCSVLIVHGLNDWNVKPKQFYSLWNSLNTQKKMILHQGDHIYINSLKSIDFNDVVNAWLSHELFGIDNNCMEELPNVMLQDNINKDFWYNLEGFPRIDVDYTSLYLKKNNVLTKDNLTDEIVKISFEDDVLNSEFDKESCDCSRWQYNIVMDESRSDSLKFTSEALNVDRIISGEASISINANIINKTGVLSAMLVDIGQDKRIVPGLNACEQRELFFNYSGIREQVVDFKYENNPSEYRIITRGCLHVQNKDSLIYPTQLDSETYYDFKFNFQPADYTIKSGHKLRLIIYATDFELMQRPTKKALINVNLNKSKLIIPNIKK